MSWTGFDQRVHGLYLSTPGLTVFPGKYTEVEEARSKFIVQTLDHSVQRLNDDFVSCTSLAPLAPLLTRMHETNHYQELTSTYFGLALWQVEVALMDCTFTGKLDSSEAGLGPHGRITRLLYEYVEALRGAADLTMSAFLALANEAQMYVSRQWGLPAREWVSMDPNRDSYLPPGHIASSEVIEATARIAELRLFESSEARTPRHLIDEWIETRIHGRYRRVTTMLLTKIGEITTCAEVCDEALMGHCALATSLGSSQIVVEEVLPSWRLIPLVQGVREILIPRDRDSQRNLLRSSLPAFAGVTPAMRAEALQSSTFATLGGLTLGQEDGGVFDDQYRRWILERYVTGFNLRMKGGGVSFFYSPAEALELIPSGGFQPLLEFYSDTLVYNEELLERHGKLFVRGYAELIRSVVAQCLASGDTDLRLLRVLESAMADLKDAFDQAGASVRDLVSYLCGQDAADLFVL